MITFTCAIGQNSDNKFARPLKDVLNDIEQEYNVKLRISDKDLDGKILNYANWRFRADVEETLKNVLGPFDLMALPDKGPNKYKIEGISLSPQNSRRRQRNIGLFGFKI